MNINDAIYNCRICNETTETAYRCDCDMGIQKPKKIPQPELLPLLGIPEERKEVNSLRGLLVIPAEDLPGDLVGKYQAIDKIFRDADKK